MLIFIDILLFTVPCWIINMSLNGIYVAKLYFPSVTQFDRPFDNNIVLPDGRRLLGNSTTWLGIVVAVVVGVVVQQILFSNKNFWQGVIIGLTVFFGHALGSFIKRRLNYSDGQFLPLVDHADYIILSGVVLGVMQKFAWPVIILGILITYIVHPIVTYLFYLLKWHKHPL